jgi:thiosulfate reductase cytochrome b subunit
MQSRPENSKLNSWLRKSTRISAWALLAGVLVLVLSGWGITQTGVIYSITFGFVDRGLANSIHDATVLPLVFFFLVHVLVNIRVSLERRLRSRTWVMDSILIIIGGAVLAAVVYMQYFRLGG